MAYEPMLLPVRLVCPTCQAQVNEAVVTPLNQAFGPVAKAMKAFSEHVVAVASAKPRRLLVYCGDAKKGVPLIDAGLGQKECEALDKAKPQSKGKPL